MRPSGFERSPLSGAGAAMEAPDTSTLRRIGDEWARAVDRLGDAERKWVDTHLRPIVTMTPTATTNEALSLGQSHFGGDPHLPENFVWPKSRLGPLRFLAQIAMADIRESAATRYYNLPTDGWLVVFACDDDGVQPGVVERNEAGERVEIPNLTHLAYVPGATPLRRTPNPCGGAEEEAAQREESGLSPDEIARRHNWACTLRFGESYDLPNVGDVHLPPLSSDQGVSALQSRLRDGWNHKLMGWPCHYRTDNTSPGPDWIDLLTLGSDDDAAWCWCDGEHLDVYVREDGLAKASFSPFYGYAA